LLLPKHATSCYIVVTKLEISLAVQNKTAPPLQVALVEDNPSDQLIITAILEQAGYQIHLFGDCDSFRRHLRTASIDLVILDWMLPDSTGLQLLEWIRHSNQAKLPVILVTGRESDEDIVEGLTSGADDYVVKPAHPEQLLARIKAILRRSGFYKNTQQENEFSPYLLREDVREIHLGEQIIKLTDREFELVLYLFRRRGNIVSRETLLKQVWNMQGTVNSRTVDTHISRLRKKLELEGQHGWRLNGIFQHGYRLEQLNEIAVAIAS
jgi:DNA-binding response OmpR family regulator